MSAAQFLIAKYVSDPVRMEPINIGIVAWSKGEAVSKFLVEGHAHKYVNDIVTYKRWITYWNELLESDSIRIGRSRPVAKSDPRFIHELSKTESESYIIRDAGEIIVPVSKRSLSGACNYLFDRLVDRRRVPKSQEKEKVKIGKLTVELFRETGISDLSDYKTNVSIPCRIRNRTRDFTFNHARVNGKVNAVYQRMNLDSLQSVNSAAFMFERVAEDHDLSPSSCGAIVYEPGLEELIGKPKDSPVIGTADLIGEFATVINLANFDEAIDKAREVAGLAT